MRIGIRALKVSSLKDAYIAALATTSSCLIVSAAAVAFATDVGQSQFGDSIVLAYHDKQPTVLVFAICAVLMAAVQNAGKLLRISAGVFTGGVSANYLAARIWTQGVPDYFNIKLIVIANAADICMILSATVIFAYVAWQLLGKAYGSLTNAPA